MSESTPKPVSEEKLREQQALREIREIEFTKRAAEARIKREGRQEIAILTEKFNSGSPQTKTGEALKKDLRFSLEINKERRRMEIVYSAMALVEGQENFPFTGIVAEEYDKMKATEDECPGYTTPIDELIERFKNEGMKVVLGDDPKSGNVYILPAQSTIIEMDSISPKQLQLSDRMNERLKKLILLMRG